MDARAGHPGPETLSAWIDGELPVAEQVAAARHVAGCPECAALAEDFRALSDAQARSAVPPVPVGLHGRVLESLRRSARPARRRWAFPLGAAATVLVGLVAVWLVQQQPVEVATPASVPPAAHAPAPAPPPGPVEKEALRAPPRPATVRPPSPRVPREEVADAPAYAPAPPAPAPEAMDSAARLAEPPFRWVARPVPERETAGATAPFRRTAAVKEEARSTAMAQAADPVERLLAASGCTAAWELDPPIPAPGVDLEDLARRARAAGAQAERAGPDGFLVLVIPRPAWPGVQREMLASGLEAPEAAEGDCLVLRLTTP